MKKLIIILLFCSIEIFSQEYEIAWEKDIGGSYAQFSKDGEFIYVAKGSLIQKYRSADGSFVSTFDNSGFKQNGSDFYGNFYLSNSGNYLIGICGQYYNVWDTKTEKAFFQFSDVNGGLDITNDESKYIASKRITPENDRIVLLDFKTQKELKSITTNQNVILGKLSHKGKMFATASISGTKYYLTLWDTETLTEIKRFELEGNTQSTRIWDIKFSWDDKFVSIRRTTPEVVNIYDTQQLVLYTKSIKYNNLDIVSNEFISGNGYFIYYYPNYDISEYNFLIIDRNTNIIKQDLHIFSNPLVTSSTNLIFTGKALLKPKTVGVSDSNQQNILISPNPADDYITIQNVIQSEAKNPGIEIFNIFGEKNLSPALSEGEGAKIKIDVSNLPAGIYLVRIGDKFEKFIKL